MHQKTFDTGETTHARAVGSRVQLVTMRTLMTSLDVCRMTIYRLQKSDPAFPKPIRIGRGVRYDSSKIEEWVKLKAGNNYEQR
jgi:predicted DNA-binding transcriptional regulator AlpA